MEFLRVRQEEAVGIIELYRPKVLNALNIPLMTELVAELERMERDNSIRVIVLTGNERAFAAGADIQEMAEQDAISMLVKDQFAEWDRMNQITKPIIAAVSGYVLGGGCELMMHCDLIVASETTQIGQPEINLGVMPGAGGTQRLTKLIGKVRAMEMLLMGDSICATEALEYGLVNRVVPIEFYLSEAIGLAHKIADKPPVAVRMIKKSVQIAQDTTLAEGLSYERNAFYLLFASADQKEGMKAFMEKRPAHFKGK